MERRSVKKKIRASMGFEPMTSALPVCCSTNWAMKPHTGSEVNLLSSYLSWGVKWCEVYEIIHFLIHYKLNPQHFFSTLSKSHCTFQILESWPWLQGNLIITWSVWNTGKAFWPVINVRFRVAKIRFSQILEYSIPCITLGKKRRKRVTLGSRFSCV